MGDKKKKIASTVNQLEIKSKLRVIIQKKCNFKCI